MLEKLKNRLSPLFNNSLFQLRSKPKGTLDDNKSVVELPINTPPNNLKQITPIVTREGNLVDYENGFNWI